MMKKLLLLVLFLSVAVASFAAIYKWVDDEGVIHYSETPPSGEKTQEMEMEPGPSENEIQQSRDRMERLLEYQKQSDELRRESVEKKRQEKAAEQLEKVERKKRCIRAWQNLHELNIDRAVYSINEKGERVYLDDEMRATQIELMKKIIETDCK